MLNFYFDMTLGPGSSPDPNIYYRTFFYKNLNICIPGSVL